MIEDDETRLKRIEIIEKQKTERTRLRCEMVHKIFGTDASHAFMAFAVFILSGAAVIAYYNYASYGAMVALAEKNLRTVLGPSNTTLVERIPDGPK